MSNPWSNPLATATPNAGQAQPFSISDILNWFKQRSAPYSDPGLSAPINPAGVPGGPMPLQGATPPSPVGSSNVANAAPGASGGTGAQPPGPLAANAAAAPAPAPAPQPPGTTLTTLPPFQPPASGTMGYPAAGVGGQRAPMMGYPAAGVGTGAGWGGPGEGGGPSLTPAPRVQGQTSQNAPPTNPNQPRGTDQATPSSQTQPTTGYYTPTTGIARGPGTWHPGSIADAIHNAGVGIGQHLDQTFGVTRPAGYYDYRGQGQPTYNGPLSQPVVNNMSGRTNLPTSYSLPSGMRMTPQGDVIGQPKQGWTGWS